MATPGTVAFHTLGCKLNFSETSTISRMFEEKGYVVGKFKDPADIYVINTCSVTDFADPASGVVRVITTFYDERVDLFEAGAIADAKRDVERYEVDRSSDQAFTLAPHS